MPEAPKTLNTFESMIQVISSLRGPGGCPWDQEQTHQTLSPYAIEEVFELVEAIEGQNDAHICEELGDVLFQVVLHASMGEERKAFNIQDVIESINSKVVRRHPHVFSDTKVSGTADVLKNWDEIKKQEKKNSVQTAKKTIDVPVGMPALQRAFKIGEKTKKLQFDWTYTSEVLNQLKSEIAELEEAMQESVSPESFANMQHEMGDILFSAAQLSRHLEIEPESCLREANRRFLNRFETMLSIKPLSTAEFVALTREQKEDLWKQVKKITS
jgi:tetrapyrrole methylase family protein / MazG family protein